MNTRINMMLVALGMLLGALEVNAQANLMIKDFTIAPGETKQVYVEMNNTVEIRALQALVNLPEGVKLSARPIVVANRNGTFIDGSSQSVPASKSLRYKMRDNGSCMIVINADDAIPFSGTEGAIISLTLKADDVCNDFSGQIVLQDVELVYADGATYVRPEEAVCKVDVCRAFTSLDKLMKDNVGRNVDVYNLNGVLLRKNAPVNKLDVELTSGIYVIDGIKVYVK